MHHNVAWKFILCADLNQIRKITRNIRLQFCTRHPEEFYIANFPHLVFVEGSL